MNRSADWMDQAQGDLEHADGDLAGGFYDWACFSAQQTAAMSLKAVFYKMNADVWGHSIYDLLVELRKTRAVDASLLDRGMELDKADIGSRYPNAHPSGAPRRRYNKHEAEIMVNHARTILQFCTDLLSALDQG